MRTTYLENILSHGLIRLDRSPFHVTLNRSEMSRVIILRSSSILLPRDGTSSYSCCKIPAVVQQPVPLQVLSSTSLTMYIHLTTTHFKGWKRGEHHWLGVSLKAPHDLCSKLQLSLLLRTRLTLSSIARSVIESKASAGVSLSAFNSSCWPWKRRASVDDFQTKMFAFCVWNMMQVRYSRVSPNKTAGYASQGQRVWRYVWPCIA